MRLTILLAVGLAVGCGKKKPQDFGSVGVSYTKSPTELTVELTLDDSQGERRFAVPGTLEVTLHEVTPDHEDGARVCGGTAPVTEASFDKDTEAKVVVTLTGCPALPRTIDKDLRIAFKATDPASVAPENEKSFVFWKPADQVEVPEDPVVVKRKAIDKAATDACAAKDTAKATAARAQVASEIEAAAASLPDGTHKAITAMLTGAQPCDRYVSIYVRWLVMGDRNSNPFDKESLTDEAFTTAAKAIEWPVKELADPIAERFTDLGAGWLIGQYDANRTADKDPWTKLELQYEVFWTDMLSLGDQATLPRMRIHGSAAFSIPGQPVVRIDLGEKAFDPGNQEVKYRPGEAAEAVVEVERRQLVGRLDVSPIFSTPTP